MVREHGRRVIESVRRAIHSDAPDPTATQALPVIDDATVLRVIDLAMRVAEVMLSVGASAKEVVLAALRITQAYGLRNVHVDVTFNSITVSDHRHGGEWPVTIMRVVRSAVPDHAKLQQLQALVRAVEAGLDLDAARLRFREVRRTPFRYRGSVVILSQALLAVGVGAMFGASWSILLVTLLAALGVALTQAGLARLQVPRFFSQIAGAFVLTVLTVLTALLARLGVEPFVDVRPTIVVSSGIVLMLAGLAVVGAAQDAIDGFSLTAGGRILELTVQTLGVVLGILVGLDLARALGVGMEPPSAPLPLGPLAAQFAGAVIVAIAVAVFNGAGASAASRLPGGRSHGRPPAARTWCCRCRPSTGSSAAAPKGSQAPLAPASSRIAERRASTTSCTERRRRVSGRVSTSIARLVPMPVSGRSATPAGRRADVYRGSRPIADPEATIADTAP